MPLNAEYARELRAVFKILEFSLGFALIVAIVLADHYRISTVGGCIIFVTVVTTITSICFFVLHLSGLVYKCTGPITLIEFICIIVCFILDLVAMIVAAATTRDSGAAIASAILFAIGFVFYGIDAFILFSYYRLNGGYVNDPKTKQRPNLPPKITQTLSSVNTTTTIASSTTTTPATSVYLNNAFEKE
ncbi:unnamed protein product [Heterobilharzia americana]|nr:unnamed protein product [Heterobilharzia americana]CAH8602526.1 unnamed protein product [Heterobilharzia americana]